MVRKDETLLKLDFTLRVSVLFVLFVLFVLCYIFYFIFVPFMFISMKGAAE